MPPPPSQRPDALSLSPFQAIAKHAKGIKTLQLYWNLKYTDAGIQALASSLAGLVDLNLSGCKQITDKSLEAVGQGCKSLERLDITRVSALFFLYVWILVLIIFSLSPLS